MSLIIEAAGHHQRIADNASRLNYIWFNKRSEGKVTLFRDDMNSLPLAEL